MRITVHSVGDGLCISLIHDNGTTMLWGCGHNDRNKPSDFLSKIGVNTIDALFITNFNKNHISDLPNLFSKFHIQAMFQNDSISVSQLQALKIKQSGEISIPTKCMLDMMRTYSRMEETPPSLLEVNYKLFYNEYYYDFYDINNISLVTFLKCKGKCFLIPGNLEVSGWRRLLKKSHFKLALQDVNVFIASHNGRGIGYYPEVFNFCNPEVIVCSDSHIQCATEEMTGIYKNHATGILFNNKKRYVLSTHKDGTICWYL
ncbi:MAG: hypothetical protein OXK80_02705 [Bdellovibrionales bacterium]|nr:hypothetical protein [Bdellovibrionales bacterium]